MLECDSRMSQPQGRNLRSYLHNRSIAIQKE
uniref:Uncharacterized protein n=1 Tax=Musa acuminata subsp. malaccensis TaxID=214687 RepID=A0A804L3T6_MUSAM